MHSHRIYTLPAHNWQGHQRIFTASSKYPHISLLRATQNSQARMRSPPYCFRMWWSNWPSLYLSHPFQPAPSQEPPIRRQRRKTFSQPHSKSPTRSTQCHLGHSWCHIPIHKHSTQRGHSRCDSLHERIQKPTTHKLPTMPYSAHIPDFILKHSTFKFMDTHIH